MGYFRAGNRVSGAEMQVTWCFCDRKGFFVTEIRVTVISGTEIGLLWISDTEIYGNAGYAGVSVTEISRFFVFCQKYIVARESIE